MNSTGKILFGSFLAISVVLMFLIFSMQKSAQLKLDIHDIQRAITAKDDALESMQKELKSVQATAQHAEVKNKLIPTLKNNLKTTEQEKLVYIQQLDDFQAELQKQMDIAEQRLTKIADLQKQQKEQQQLLNKSADDIAAAGRQNAKLATTLQNTQDELTKALHATQQEITTRELELTKYLETLAQKDRVIQIYKEKLDKAAEDMELLQIKDSNDKLNLKLILDELATKTATVEELANQLNWINNPDAQEQKSQAQESSTKTDNGDNQALIIKLSLENDNIGLELQEYKKRIEELQTKLSSNKELVTSYATEVEQLRLTNSAKDNDIRILQNKLNGIELNITQLKSDLNNKEKELQEAKTQTQAIAKPLTEKITSLELQLTQGATQYTQLAKSLSQAQTNLAALQNDKQALTDQLNALKTAKANAETELASLSGILKNKEAVLLQEEDTRQSLASKIDPLKQALAESEKKYAALNNSFTILKEELACTVKSKEELNTTFEFLRGEVAEQDTTIEKLEKQLAGANAQLIELKGDIIEADLEQAKIDKVDTESEERIAKLIEEVAAAKAKATDLAAKNNELVTAVNQKQDQIAKNESLIAKLKAAASAHDEATPEKVEPSAAATPEANEMVDEQPMEIKVITEETPETLDKVMEKVRQEASEEKM
jgi:chromosome segregation ATPase